MRRDASRSSPSAAERRWRQCQPGARTAYARGIEELDLHLLACQRQPAGQVPFAKRRCGLNLVRLRLLQRGSGGGAVSDSSAVSGHLTARLLGMLSWCGRAMGSTVASCQWFTLELGQGYLCAAKLAAEPPPRTRQPARPPAASQARPRQCRQHARSRPCSAAEIALKFGEILVRKNSDLRIESKRRPFWLAT